MQAVANQTLKHQVIQLDHKHFIDCVLFDCILEHSGGPIILQRTRLRGCKYVVRGEDRPFDEFMRIAGLLPEGCPIVTPVYLIN